MQSPLLNLELRQTARRQMPSWPLQVNRTHPISNGLSFVYAFNNSEVYRPIYATRYVGTLGKPGTSYGKLVPRAQGPGGVGLSGKDPPGQGPGLIAYGGAPIMPLAGSLMSFVSWGENNVTTWPTIVWIENGVKDFDLYQRGSSGIYAGWNYVTDTRAVAGAQYVPAINAVVVFGVTWGPSGTNCWLNGSIIASNGTPTSAGDTTGFNFWLGIDPASRSFLGNSTTSKNGYIYWLAIWDRVLSNAEAIYLACNPMTLFLPAEDGMPAIKQLAGLHQRHFRFRTDTDLVNAAPTWGGAEDQN